MEHESKYYTVKDDNDFNQWMYIFNPTEFIETTKGISPSFVKKSTFHKEESEVHMDIDVNYVYSSAGGGGHTVGPRRFKIVFELITD